jgi:hypothetical protein
MITAVVVITLYIIAATPYTLLFVKEENKVTNIV